MIDKSHVSSEKSCQVLGCDPVVLTVGLRKTPSFWIFGSPYNSEDLAVVARAHQKRMIHLKEFGSLLHHLSDVLGSLL